MYTVLFLEGCPYSHAAIELLRDQGENVKIIFFGENIVGDEERINALGKKYKIDRNDKVVFDKKIFKDYFGQTKTFPRVYKEEEFIGGYNELEKHFKIDI
jgi:glutaredoxin